MAQMEWREAIADARAAANVDQLEALSQQLHHAGGVHKTVRAAANVLDIGQATAHEACKLRFLEKLDQEIGDAIEALLY